MDILIALWYPFNKVFDFNFFPIRFEINGPGFYGKCTLYFVWGVHFHLLPLPCYNPGYGAGRT